MGLGYRLINIDKRQKICFYNVVTGTKLRELSGTVVASSIVTYYLLKNIGDKIGFVNDSDDKAIVCGQEYQSDDFREFTDVTNETIDLLIKDEIIKDNGVVWIDKDDNLFNRDLVNIWDPKLS